MVAPRGYESIKELSSQDGIPITDLLALHRNNDPFFAGSPGQRLKAEWFAGLWQRFGYSTGVHLRRVHYQLVSQPNATLPNGRPYENTEACWKVLCDSGKLARYLKLVQPTAFEDHRNPQPQVNATYYGTDSEPSVDLAWSEWSLPVINSNLAGRIELDVPSVNVRGYSYDRSDQPYHVELWVEKSTMDDVLEPICRRFGINYVTSLGFQSITSFVALLHRVAESDKPARIFYISDFDPAGDAMPVQAARHLEYWAATYAPYSEIKLTPIALTREQVETYGLPPIPVKESDLRGPSFEERYGVSGAVELDALEALHPGSLGDIVRQVVQPYFDEDLASRLEEAHVEALGDAGDLWHDLTVSEAFQLEKLASTARAIVEGYQSALQDLSERMATELAPLEEKLEEVRKTLEQKASQLKEDVDLPDRPDADAPEPDESDWLYDSNRDYMEQLEVYRARKAGEL